MIYLSYEFIFCKLLLTNVNIYAKLIIAVENNIWPGSSVG